MTSQTKTMIRPFIHRPLPLPRGVQRCGCVAFMLTALLLSGSAAAAPLDDAQAAFRLGDWQAVVDLLANVESPGAQEGLLLCSARVQLEEYREALAACESARAAGASGPQMDLSEAAARAQLDQPERSLELLETAVAGGLPPRLFQRPAFDPIRDLPKFAELEQRSRQRANPCLEQPESRQFDFWIGTWDVHAAGRIAGRNVISVRHQGCLIFEDYTAGAFTGQSFNYWDPATSKWRQTWIDNGGNVTHYEGSPQDGSMVFEGINQGRNGGATKLRMTFTPNDDGSVRQHIEQWNDDASTWTTSFDGLYVPVKEP